MSAIAQRRFSTLQTEPLRNFKFHVVFTPIGKQKDSTSNATAPADQWNESTMGGFTSVSGLTQTTEAIAYREGGYNTSVHQMAGITTFSPISFQRGVMYGSSEALETMEKVYQVPSGTSVVNGVENYRYNIDIYVLHHPRDMTDLSDGFIANAAMQFRVYNAWLTTVAYSDLNAGENGFLVEQMAWVHEGWEAKIAKNINGNSTII